MTTGSDKCSIASLIPMSCRNKAEAFARRLHSRLSSLGSQDGRRSVDESSWLAARENSVALSQPRHSDPDLYFDFTLAESPGTPEEEVPQIELARLITNEKDNLILTHGDDCHCTKQQANPTVVSLGSNGQTISPDSDSSDGQYFDPDTDDRLVISDEVDGAVLGAKSNDSLSINSLSCTSEASTLSLQDCPSLEYSSCQQELSTQNSVVETDSQLDLHFLTPQGSHEIAEINGDVCDVECDSIRLGNDDIQALTEREANHTDAADSNSTLQNGCLHLEPENDKDEDEESYRSTLRIENALTLDIHRKPPEENDEINEIELEINNHDNTDTDSVEDREEPIPRVRRCSSLKTGKTPPGTPGRKKIVRFADVLGLDLADVRTFLDEIPKIPNSAYADLNTDTSCFERDSSYGAGYKHAGPQSDRILLALFQQPGGETNFLDRVRDNQVCLENAIVDDPIALSIKGTVRVRNLDFNKSVHIRYSLDSWKTFSDLQATYVENSCDGFSDKFSFLMYVNTITVGQRVEFAVRFQCKGVQYWDSNNGVNYCFQCLPVTNTTNYAPITGVEDSWGAAFYYADEESTSSSEYSWHRQAAVQEYIAATLQKKKKQPAIAAKRSNPDLFSVIVIIIFSIVFLYIQRAIYFK